MHEQQAFRSELSKPNWLARMPKGWRKLLEYCFAVLAVSCFIVQLYTTRSTVLSTAEANPPPIEFNGLWHPDRKVLHPGETVRFYYTRTTRMDHHESGLIIVSLDAFENKTNGEIFEGSVMGRVIDAAGTVQRVEVIRIPDNCSAGEYQFEGWTQAFTSHRSLPVAYKSEMFTVKLP